MTKNKKRKLRYYAETVFFMLCTASQLFMLSQHMLKHFAWPYIVKDLIWLVLSVVVTVGAYLSAKDVGTSEDLDADERNKYLSMKTEQQVLKIFNTLLFVLGYGFLAGGVIFFQKSTTSYTAFVLVAIAIVLIALWNLLIVIELVLYFVNDYRN
ncbi:hypothetical protein EQ500_01190 [Lactobacillus sp. XV13L]|nr:hypothetical protein [Lactobacillus sp. XV13L]